MLARPPHFNRRLLGHRLTRANFVHLKQFIRVIREYSRCFLSYFVDLTRLTPNLAHLRPNWRHYFLLPSYYFTAMDYRHYSIFNHLSYSNGRRYQYFIIFIRFVFRECPFSSVG